MSILTEHTDAEIGRGVRGLAEMLLDENGNDALNAMSFAQALAGIVSRANAEDAEFTLTGVTYQKKPMGDWKITLQRLKEAPSE